MNLINHWCAREQPNLHKLLTSKELEKKEEAERHSQQKLCGQMRPNYNITHRKWFVWWKTNAALL